MINSAIEIFMPALIEIICSLKISLIIGCSAPRIEVTKIFGGFSDCKLWSALIRAVTVSPFGLNRSCGKVSQAGKFKIPPPV